MRTRRGGRAAVVLVSVFMIAGVLAPTAASAAAPTITSFSPTAGSAGTVVSVHGTNFTGATAVKFNGAATFFSVTSATLISAVVPSTASTGHIAVTTPSGTVTSTATFTVRPGLALSVPSGLPGASVTVSGGGFAAFEGVDLFFDTTDEVLAGTNATGNFGPIAITVPAATASGKHWISAEGRHSGLFAQTPFTVNVDWPDIGFGPTHQSFNPYEKQLTTSNVDDLGEAWSVNLDLFANAMPLVELGGNIYSGNVEGTVRAVSSTGTILWTAAPGGDMQFVYPAAAAGRVFFGDGSGNVRAYGATCRSDGGVCAPLWTRSVGTAVTGSLTVSGNLLYAPSADGTVHVLNPATGVPGTALAPFSPAGPVTQALSLAPDTTDFFAVGSHFEYKALFGAGNLAQPGNVSGIALGIKRAYFTTTDGSLHEFQGQNWTATTSGTGCATAPAIAGGTVYAGGCSTLGAYDAATGQLRWSVPTTGPVLGVTVANGVVYACTVGTFSGLLVAYDTFSDRLWSGGPCDGAPLVVNGTLYATGEGDLTAYTLNGIAPHAAVQPARAALTINTHLRLQG